jgi:hypothetical protein
MIAREVISSIVCVAYIVIEKGMLLYEEKERLMQ